MKRAVHTALAALGPLQRRLGPHRHALRILCYHGLWVTPGYTHGDRLFMPPDQFERRMRHLAEGPYTVLPLGEAVERLYAGTLPPWSVAVTADDGWAATHSHMLPILERWRVPMTVYVPTWHVLNGTPITGVAVGFLAAQARPGATWTAPSGQALPVRDTPESIRALSDAIRVGRPLPDRVAALRDLSRAVGVPPETWEATRQFELMTPAEVADCAARGIDIQLHSHRHRGMMAPDTQAREVEDNRAALAPMAGGEERLVHFCYPSGNFHPGSPRTLAALGLRSATTTIAGLNTPATNRFLLRRFLDGRTVTMAEFEAYLTGGLEVLAQARGRAAA